jgi:hypothetical protein
MPIKGMQATAACDALRLNSEPFGKSRRQLLGPRFDEHITIIDNV